MAAAVNVFVGDYPAAFVAGVRKFIILKLTTQVEWKGWGHESH